MDETMEETKFDPKRRRLCPDGACIGLIGADGRCNECGRAADGSASAATSSSASAAPDDEPAPVRASEPLPEGGFDPKRRLCDDGGCTGVVGADGVCRECGRRAEG
jgi:hypothetical protein